MTDRVVKVNELLKQLAGDLLLKEVDFGTGVLVTVTRVETSPDLRYGKILITVLPRNKERDVLATLEAAIFDLQQLLNKKLRMRLVPKIRFVIDQTEKEAAKIEELLARVREEEAEEK